MTKQEEIREGITRLIEIHLADDHRISATRMVRSIIPYLRSKGCVIKVEREFPKTLNTWREDAPIMNYVRRMLDDGWVAVEELI